MDEHIFELTSAERAGAAAAASSTPKPLGIVSIKTRAVAMDRGLCLERSRYHPHFPKCHLYCKHLDHWIGQCRRESCHCIS
ncbi:CG34331 [Drosophila busckii]|uniref:CG34331 n=2 Tax=Drosophila busckii TaxID=30019 RepID=A0A0M4ER03_DROBS|nr:CG34331 [Drosophila busckii]